MLSCKLSSLKTNSAYFLKFKPSDLCDHWERGFIVDLGQGQGVGILVNLLRDSSMIAWYGTTGLL